MDAGTIITVIGANIALISWLRSDMKAFEAKVERWTKEVSKETQDFHGRLCQIEEARKHSCYHETKVKAKKGAV